MRGPVVFTGEGLGEGATQPGAAPALAPPPLASRTHAPRTHAPLSCISWPESMRVSPTLGSLPVMIPLATSKSTTGLGVLLTM